MKLYLSLGANLGNREQTLLRAIELLALRLGEVLRRSAFYETQPVGFTSEHLFLNAAVEIETELPAGDILHVTQSIERELGRTEKSLHGHYADRPIDIDLLLCGDVEIKSNNLTLPHPQLPRRRFVLEPLCEIAPDLFIPALNKTVSALLAQLNIPTFKELTPADCHSETLSRFNLLLGQLSEKAHPLTLERMRELAADGASRVYLVFDETETLCGTASLILVQQPTGCKAWIEDVVIDAACRGRGYARRLIQHLLREAKRMRAESANLTSRPERTAANQLYRACGFRQRETNVYQYSL